MRISAAPDLVECVGGLAPVKDKAPWRARACGRRVGTGDYSPVPLTEPYVRVTHTAPWIGMSEFQRELVRDLRGVEVVPPGFERGHPAGEPAWWIGSCHCRAV